VLVVVALVVLFLLGAGVFAWTLGEYLIHRFVMHEVEGRSMPSREHLIHHATGGDNAGRPVLSWLGIVVVGAVLFAAPGWLLAGPALGHPVPGLALYAGWLLGYGGYEQIHNRSHTHGPRNAYGRWVRTHHFHHHHGHPLTNHGVTSPLWDRIFGTLVLPEVICVPRCHTMPWLVDEAGVVKPEFADRYELVGPADPDARQAAIDRARAFANLPPIAAT
jgi:sterol desaturase/sphingolipid hydroxylase (fatty acid hydroxylase superfamily)